MFDARAVLTPLIDLLHDVRDGAPRWITLHVPRRDAVVAIQHGIAETAEAHGFLPLALAEYFRVREVRASDIGERSLVLVAPPSTPLERCRTALLHAAAGSARPHVLVVLAPAPGAGPSIVREARASYGPLVDVPPDLVRYIRRAERCDDLVRRGCHAAAERLLREVLGALVRRRVWGNAAGMGVLLGRLLLERGRAIDAAAVFGASAEHAGAAGLEGEAARARTWQAAARVDAGLLVQAEAQCRAVAAAAVPDADAQRHAATTLARVLLWQERVDEAVDVRLSPLSEAGTDAYTLAMMTRVALAAGDVFAAGRHARALLDEVDRAQPADARVHLLALVAHLRVLVASGDLSAAAARLQEVAHAARHARTPLQLARARLIWVDGLRRAGRTVERELAWLRKIQAVAPPLLRSAIERRLRGDAVAPVVRQRISLAPATLLTIARDEADDRAAVTRLMSTTFPALRCSRLDLHSCDAGPATVLLSAGSGAVSLSGRRALDAGIAIGPEAAAHGVEAAVPVRLGHTVLAALSARWPADRKPPTDAMELMELLAAAAAPRVEAMLTAARQDAGAAVLVPELIGTSAAMTELRKGIARAAAAPFAVLIQGESGVGKELVARAIHQLGPRRERRWCDINCAAIPDDLLEAELFGHARGAFTGAVADRRGLFEEADGGTLFLDEVADLSARAQASLLRSIQQQQVRRVGETFTRPVDVRIIAAANRDLRAEAAEGRFRQDLLYRLDVLRVTIPPLRERPEDIVPLAGHFWQTAIARVGSQAQLSHALLAALARYHWPGNVRELQNAIAALAVAAPSRGMVRPHLLPAAIAGAAAVRGARLSDARLAFERRFVEAALARAGGNRTRAARELGVSRQGLIKILTRVGVA